MKKGLAFPLLILLIVPVQTLLLPRFGLWGAVPDLALVAIFLIGFRYGELVGLWTGMGIGLLFDMISLGSVGVNFLLRSAVGFGAGLLGRTVLDMTVPVLFATVTVLSLVQDLAAYYLIYLGSSDLGYFGQLRWNLLVRAAYSGGVAVLCHRVVGRRLGLRSTEFDKRVLFTPGGDSGASR